MALDADDIKKISELITGVVAPLQASLKPEELAKTLAPAIQAHVKEGTKGAVTEESLKAFGENLAKTLKPADDPDKDKGKGGDKGKGEKSPEVAQLEAQIAELTRKSTEAENAAKAEREKARTTALHGAARDALLEAGIPADRIDLVLPVLREQGVFAYDGDRPGWKGKNDVGLDAVLDMKTQAKAWAQTPAGKVYLPPKGAAGDGSGGGNGSGGGAGGDVSLDSLRGSATGTVLGALARLS